MIKICIDKITLNKIIIKFQIDIVFKNGLKKKNKKFFIYKKISKKKVFNKYK